MMQKGVPYQNVQYFIKSKIGILNITIFKYPSNTEKPYYIENTN